MSTKDYFSLGIRMSMALILVACTGQTPSTTLRISLTATPASSTKPPLTPLSSVIVPTETNNGFIAGRSIGYSSVSADGMANYDLPLWVPPGRLGIQPDLSLSYDSREGNGLLGVGWTLNGIIQITRCRRTFVQDGEAREVRFMDGDAGDRFCLNGQRLVAVGSLPGTPGVYGGNETEYRLERDAHIKIVSYAPDNSGPTYFRVYLKNGRILTLGGTDDSKLEGQRVHATSELVTTSTGTHGETTSEYKFSHDYSQQVRYAWSLSRVEDRSGNFMTIHYHRIAHSSHVEEQRPERIEYTASSSLLTLSATRFVEFLYEPRPDIEEYYVGGFRLTTSVRLKTVKMRWGPDQTTAKLLRQYIFQYRNNSVTGRSLLDQVQECDGADICLAPTQFQWSLGTGSYADINTGQTYVVQDQVSLETPTGLISTTDRDGDGRDEVISIPNNIDYSYFLDHPGGLRPPDPRYVDLNADGRADRLSFVLPPRPSGTPNVGYRHVIYKNRIELSTSSGFQIIEDEQETYHLYQKPAYALDLNGDGLPDLLKALPTQPEDPEPWKPYKWGIRWNSNGSFGNYEKTTLSAPILDPRIQAPFIGLAVDLNGSGRMSLLQAVEHEDGALSFVDGTIAIEPTNWRNDFCSSSFFLDANGDGLADWIAPGPEDSVSAKISFNSGHGFMQPVVWSIPSPYSDSISIFDLFPCRRGDAVDVHSGVRVIDYNGDGFDDLLLMGGYTHPSGTRRLLVLESTSAGFNPVPLSIGVGQSLESGADC